MKSENSRNEYQYTVYFEPAEEGGYIVTCPALPGLVTEETHSRKPWPLMPFGPIWRVCTKTEVTPLLWTVYGFRIKPHLSASIHS